MRGPRRGEKKRKYTPRAAAVPKTMRTPAEKREYDRLRKREQRKNKEEGTSRPVGHPRKVDAAGEAISMGAVDVITRSRFQVTLAGVVLVVKQCPRTPSPSHPPHPPAGSDRR